MTFQEWFNSTPHRAKYSGDHPAYLAAQEAWEASHEACAKVCDIETALWEENSDGQVSLRSVAAVIRARGQE